MPNLDPTLLKYASSCFQQGYKEPEIRRFLMQAGYDPASIDAAMNAIRGAPAPSTPPTPPTPPSREGAAQWGGAVPWGAAPPSSTTPPAFPPAPSAPAAQTEDGGGGSGFVGKAMKILGGLILLVIGITVVVISLSFMRGMQMRQLPIGSPCTSPRGCISGHCVNGVCCEAGHQCCGEPHHCGTGEAAPRTCDFSKHYCVEKSSLATTPVPPIVNDDCYGLSDGRRMTDCYTQTGYDAPDVSRCDGMRTIDGTSLCVIGYVNRTGDDTLCETMVGDTDRQPECYRFAAIAKEELTVCDKIADAALRDSCKGRVIVHVCLAEDSNDKSMDCIRSNGYEAEDISFCDGLPLTESGKFYCYLGYVNRTGDISICDSKIANDGGRQGCYRIAATVNKDRSQCEKITIPPLKDTCYQDVAVSAGDESICKMVSDGGACYGAVAASKKDVSVCDMTDIPSDKSYCIREYVRITRDTAYCYTFEPGWERDLCLSAGGATPMPESTPGPSAVITPTPTAGPTTAPTLAPTPIPTTEPTPVPTPESTSTPTPTPSPTPTPTAVPTPIPTPTPAPDTISDIDLEDIEIAFIQAFDSGAVSLSQIKNKRKETIAITSVSTCTGIACTVGEAEGCQGVSGEDLFGTEIKYGDYIYLQNCYNNGERVILVSEGQEVPMKLRLSYKVSGSESEMSTATAEFTIRIQEAQTPLVTPIPPPESYVMDLPFERFNANFIYARDTGEIIISSLNNTGVDDVSIRGILTCLGESCEPKLSPECIGYRRLTETIGLDQTLAPGTGLFVRNCYNNGESYELKGEGEEITFRLAILYTIADTLEERTTETKFVTLKVSKATWSLHQEILRDLTLDAHIGADIIATYDSGEFIIGNITNSGSDPLQVTGIWTCLGESCIPQSSPGCRGYSYDTSTPGMDQALMSNDSIFVSNCYNNGDTFEPKAEGEDITLGFAIEYYIFVVDTLEKRTTETKHITLKVSKASKPLKANPLDLPYSEDYEIWTLTSTVSYDFTRPPGWEIKHSSFGGLEEIAYAYMDPIFPAIYQNSVDRGLKTAAIVVEPDGEITDVTAFVRIRGITDWEPASAASVSEATLFEFSIPATGDLFSYERKTVPIDFKLTYTWKGDDKEWLEGENVDVSSRNDFYYGAEIVDIEGVTEQDYRALLATFVTPNDPKVQEVITKAKEYLPDRTFDGYLSGEYWSTESEVSKGRDNVMEEVAAIYKALQEMDVSYVNSPISYTGHQSIRLPADSIGEASANCLDGTLLFASALEHVAINPLIVLVPGHAYVGFQIDKKEKNFVFLETTMVGTHRFSDAIRYGTDQGRECIGETCPKFIDIKQARALGINPIATG